MKPMRSLARSRTEGMGFGATLAARAESEPELNLFTCLSDDLTEAEEVSAAEAHRRAQTIAAGLRERQEVGSRTLLLFPPGLDYVCTVYGCFQAGVVGVSAPPPQPNRLQRTLPRLTAIAADAQIDSVLTTAFIRDAAKPLFADGPLAATEWIAIDELPEPDTELLGERPLTELAFLQYTSGSTRSPRGVMLSQENLMVNSDLIAEAFGHSPGEARGVIWLPPYHDMGLIGGILQPVHAGGNCVLLSPLAVVKRPARWLQAISRYGATTSGGPNFAYDLCVQRVDEEIVETLDLSSWRVAFNGAEPIRAQTIEQFARKFSSAGFRREAFYPCYGLAEATLIVTGPDREDEPSLLEVDSAAVERGRIEPSSGESGTRTLVGCGTVFADHELAIVDPESGEPCREGEIGEVWTAGPSVALGYWNQEDETAEQFGATLDGESDGRWLRSGDLGALVDGELFVVGRIKELIIANGRNIHPHDVEWSAEEAHPALRRHCSAAYDRADDGPAEVALLLEVDGAEELDPAAVIAAVRERVAADLDLPLAWVGLCGRGEIPKTTSGKIQRNLCRRMVAAGEFGLIAEAER
ncbi:MAG TPA: fatty acyl-AMP ligase [Solirubrobacterales bacterium]|nr:fatty acyl-AMP ligase [Solirubrobacterales bacterium]